MHKELRCIREHLISISKATEFITGSLDGDQIISVKLDEIIAKLGDVEREENKGEIKGLSERNRNIEINGIASATDSP